VSKPVNTGEILEGRYAIEREVGEGGMARVYLVRDLRHDRHLALKIVRTEVSASLGAERFLSEIDIIAKLTHPNILPLHDSGTVRDQLYFVSSFMDGGSLRDRLARSGRMTPVEVVRVVRDVAGALAYAHERGVIHRDVKPENILFSGGVAVVADFGIARAVAAAGGERLTMTGIVLGTPRYMSPEQGLGDKVVDGRADIYSLACVVFEMLTGQAPYSGESSMQVMVRHAHQPVPSARKLRPDLSPAVDAVLTQALAKDPDDRYPTPTDFAVALEAAVGGTGPLPPRASAPTTRWLLAGMTAAVLALGAVVLRPKTIAPAAGGSPGLIVLPFEHLGQPEDRFIAEGLSDEVTTRVSAISGLNVVARTSAQHYAASRASIESIGREANVSYAVTATVRTDRAPNGTRRVRVTPHLVRVGSTDELWTDTYDASFVPGELFALQSNIAERVAGALGVTVLQPEARQLAARPTANPAAYAAFLRANLLAVRRYEEQSAREAIGLYREAVTADPNFALAWAKMAEVMIQYDNYFQDKGTTRFANARLAIERAATLDSSLTELPLARGLLAWFADLDADRAFRELSVARRNQPNNVDLLWIIGQIDRRKGRVAEAVETMRRAAALDPRSHLVALDHGVTLLTLRRFEEARREVERARALAPDWAPAVVMQALVAWSETGRPAAGRAVIDGVGNTVSMREMLKWMYRYPSMPVAMGSTVQDSVLALSVSTDFVDPAKLHLSKGYIFQARRALPQATAQFDSARRNLEPRVAAADDDAELHGLLGIAYAGLGQREAARREGDRGLALMPLARDNVLATTLLSHRIDIAIMNTDVEDALTHIATVLSVPSQFSKAMIREDPWFALLRSSPRFAAITGGAERRL
jgi:eukaryotic-like serine/threonine-protein kinase